MTTSKELGKMSRDERSLLLYLETRAVDCGGRVDTIRMNQDDFDIAKKWNDEGFIRFGRIVMRHHNSEGTHWCLFSDDAWKLAHQERKARWERIWLKKDWLTTEDNIDVSGNPRFSGMNSPENFKRERARVSKTADERSSR